VLPSILLWDSRRRLSTEPESEPKYKENMAFEYHVSNLCATTFDPTREGLK